MKPTIHDDTNLVGLVNGAIRCYLDAHGTLKKDNIGSLTKRIVSALEGVAHSAIVNHMNMTIDRQKFVVVEKSEYEALQARDLRKQIKFLSDRLKEIDPTFNKGV